MNERVLELRECGVCLNNRNLIIVCNICKNGVCSRCAYKWYKQHNTCVYCRSEFVFNEFLIADLIKYPKLNLLTLVLLNYANTSTNATASAIASDYPALVASQYDNVEILKYLINNGTRLDVGFLDAAMMYDSHNTIEYLLKKGLKISKFALKINKMKAQQGRILR